MLVLSRKKNEQIVIGELVVITIVEIRGDKVRLGIDAPKEVPVHLRGKRLPLGLGISDRWLGRQDRMATNWRSSQILSTR